MNTYLSFALLLENFDFFIIITYLLSFSLHCFFLVLLIVYFLGLKSRLQFGKHGIIDHNASLHGYTLDLIGDEVAVYLRLLGQLSR